VTAAELDVSMEDKMLTSKVKVALKVDDATSPYVEGVKVGSRNRIVHLSGKVPSQEVKKQFSRVVRSVAEVAGVRNNLEVG